MTKINLPPLLSANLDLIRGGAAIAVLVYHIRYRFFLDYADIPDPDLLAKAFYAITSFGHDAVMVFFVLSGYFISRSILARQMHDRWSWKNYSLDRLSRLYIVLIPALALTWGLDYWGLSTNPSHPVYTGELQNYIHDFSDVKEKNDLLTLLGNTFFLQTISVSTYGSNVALWSLSFEFWYYLIFPLVIFTVLPGVSAKARAVTLTLALVSLVIVSATMLFYFTIWLLGAYLAYIDLTGKHAVKKPVNRKLGVYSTGLLFLIVLLGSHTNTGKGWIDSLVHDWPNLHTIFGPETIVTDYLIGFTFALWMFFLIKNGPGQSVPYWYESFASRLAGCSYSLYLTHLPILVFFRSYTPIEPWAVNSKTVIQALLLALVSFMFAYLFAYWTERRTGVVRNWLIRKMN